MCAYIIAYVYVICARCYDLFVRVMAAGTKLFLYRRVLRSLWDYEPWSTRKKTLELCVQRVGVVI